MNFVVIWRIILLKLERSANNAIVCPEEEIEKREGEVIEIVTDGFLIFLTRSIYSGGYVLKNGSWSSSSLASDATLETSTIGNDLEQFALKYLIVIFQLTNRLIQLKHQIIIFNGNNFYTFRDDRRINYTIK